jgi:transcriptional regulator with XRE-family HTH domain
MIGNIIRKIRIKRLLSESELARRSGHAVSTIHGIENGDNENPGFKLIGDIASVLEIPLDELYQATLGKGKA